MNTAQFAGRIGRDAEVRSTQSGKKVAGFSLAVDVGWGDNKETLWVDCSYWGERGEKLAPYLTKGKQVSVSGDVGLRTYAKNDGSQGAAITLDVARLTLQGGGEKAAAAARPMESYPSTPAAKPVAAAGDHDFNDVVPF